MLLVQVSASLTIGHTSTQNRMKLKFICVHFQQTNSPACDSNYGTKKKKKKRMRETAQFKCARVLRVLTSYYTDQQMNIALRSAKRP